MKLNGEAIYGTTASPFTRPAPGAAGRKSQATTLYLHVFDWPKDGKLSLPGLNKPLKAYLLAAKDSILDLTTHGENRLTIQVPAKDPDKIVRRDRGF